MVNPQVRNSLCETNTKKKNAEIKTQNTIEQQHPNNTMDPFGFWRQTAKPNPQNRRKRGRVLAPKREEGSSFSLPRNFINIITEVKDVAAAQLKSGHDQILFCDGDIIDLMT